MTDHRFDEVLGPLRAVPEVIGIVLVGSGSRRYRDAMSDNDIEVIVRDEYFGKLEEHQKFYVHPEERAEVIVFTESDFLAKVNSTADIDHWPYEECVVLHDPIGFLSDTLPLIVAMDEETREARVKLHYWEFLFGAARVARTLSRGDELNVRMVTAQLMLSLVRLVFVAQYRWPPILHWVTQNLSDLPSLPPELKMLLIEMLREPSTECATGMIRCVDSWMADQGYTYPFSKTALTAEVAGPQFRTYRVLYGIL